MRPLADPARGQWTIEAADASLHIIHNFIMGGAILTASKRVCMHCSVAQDLEQAWGRRAWRDRWDWCGGVRHLATVESPAWQQRRDL